MKTLVWLIGAIVVFSLSACKSTYEKQGDKHLKDKRYHNALKRYSLVEKKGEGSKEFNGNLIQAYIGAMGVSYASGANAEMLRNYKDKINALMAKTDLATAGKNFSEIASKVGVQMILEDEYDMVEVGFSLLKSAEKNKNKSPDVLFRIAKAKKDFIAKNLAEAKEYYNQALEDPDDEEPGILAEYTVQKMLLFVDQDEEIKEFRKQLNNVNMDVYLMYDRQGLIENLVSAVNKYGVLMGITSYKQNGRQVKLKVNAYNGTSDFIQFTKNNFFLVDETGNKVSPKSVKGFNKKNDKVKSNYESDAVILSFNLKSGAVPDYLQYMDTDSSVSKKYLP